MITGTKLIEDSIRNDQSRRLLIQLCGQMDSESFEQAFPDQEFASIARFEKGTYAEVFRAIHLITGQEVVFKVIRAVPQTIPKSKLRISLKGCEFFNDILREVIITKELSKLDQPNLNHMCRSFPKIISLKLVSGRIPNNFLDVEESRGNLSPPRKEPFDTFPDARIEHVVIVMPDAGKPLWRMFKERLLTQYQVLSIAKQIAFALAVAESAYEFEHRDLHNSNILIKETDEEYVEFCLDGECFRMESCGVIASLIDNTFSRYRISE